MSDEPQPLRLKPRPPPGGEAPGPPSAAPPSPGAPGGDQGDAARLRLKPRLNLTEDPARSSPTEEPPPPAVPAAVAPPEGFKLRPKNAPTASPLAPGPHEVPAPPPPALPTLNIPPPPRSGGTMPPMSVLSPPPTPGSALDAPPVPGSVPKLSLGVVAPPGPPPAPGKPGLNMKVAGDAPKKIGGKTVVKPAPGKVAGLPPGVAKRKPKLGLLAKVGIAVLVVAVAVGGLFTYRIFFPAPIKEVIIKVPSGQRGPSPADVAKAQAAAAKAAADAAAVSIRLADEKAHKAAAAAAAAIPTPTPTPDTPESVMVATDLTSDVKVNSTHLDAAPAASPAFRAYVASATIGGVFQGHPARALINGAIVREGQVVEEPLGISFERIDVEKKAIFFKDTTGAEVSKNY